MCEDGMVGRPSLPSYGSVEQEVKRCSDKAIFVGVTLMWTLLWLFCALQKCLYDFNKKWYGFKAMKVRKGSDAVLVIS